MSKLPFHQEQCSSQTIQQTPAPSDTPLTHSLLDTMGLRHCPFPDTGTSPIATRLLYHYTQGTALTLVNPIEKHAIRQKASTDSYEDAKKFIVSSLFKIKDDSFRKIACCLVADYLGTSFLSQGGKTDPPVQQSAYQHSNVVHTRPQQSEQAAHPAPEPPPHRQDTQQVATSQRPQGTKGQNTCMKPSATQEFTQTDGSAALHEQQQGAHGFGVIAKQVASPETTTAPTGPSSHQLKSGGMGDCMAVDDDTFMVQQS